MQWSEATVFEMRWDCLTAGGHSFTPASLRNTEQQLNSALNVDTECVLCGILKRSHVNQREAPTVSGSMDIVPLTSPLFVLDQ